MNKKIRDFAEKIFDVGHIEKHADEIFSQHLTAFAELIAEDCASIAYRATEDGDQAAQGILYEYNIDDAWNQK